MPSLAAALSLIHIYFVRQDYDDAVTTCARNVAQTIADIYGVSLSGGNTGNNNPYNEPSYERCV